MKAAAKERKISFKSPHKPIVCRIQTKASAQQRLRFRIEQTVRRTTADQGIVTDGSADQ